MLKRELVHTLILIWKGNNKKMMHIVNCIISVSEIPLLMKFWKCIGGDLIQQKLALRGHRFSIQWDLFAHMAIISLSLLPFAFTGQRVYSAIPLTIWGIYNVLFLIGAR